MQDYKQLEQQDLEREYEAVVSDVNENNSAKDLSKIGKLMAAYSLAAGIASTGLVSLSAPAGDAPEAPTASTAQVSAPSHKASSNRLAAIFWGAGGMTIIGGALASTRRAGIMSGELLDNENLAVLEQRQAELKSELDTRRRRSIGIMLQAEMKV